MRYIKPLILLFCTMHCAFNACWALDSELENAIKMSTPLDPNPKALEIEGRIIHAQVMDTDGVQFFGIHDSFSSMRVLTAIVVIKDRLVVADYEGVLHGFNIQKSNPSKLKVDLSFGNNGKIDVRSNVLEMKRFGEDEIILKTPRDLFLLSNGKLKKPNIDIPLISNATARRGITYGTETYLYELDPKSGHYNKSLWMEHKNQNAYPVKHEFFRIESATIKNGKIFFGDNYIDKASNHYSWGGVTCVDLENKEILFNITSIDTENDSYFGTSLDIESTSRGVTILDSNMRALTLVSPEGEIVEKIKGMDFWSLFDIGYLWAADSSSDSEGNLYVVAASERDDEKIAEGFIYRISGL